MVSIILPKLVSGKTLYLAGGISLMGLIASTILIIPLMTDLISRGLEVIYGAVLGNEGWLAARNMRGNKNIAPVSYTHLDVYKRQGRPWADG